MKDKGRKRARSEVICIFTCSIYLCGSEGSIWRLPADEVGRRVLSEHRIRAE